MQKIVVVEDEGIVAFNLQQRLQKLGYEVPGIFASGEQLIDDIDQLSPDLILMDVHIQGALDGIETAARLHEKLRIPVVYLTAHAEETTLERARATKPYGYLLKPFSERELHATIQMALERCKLDQALFGSEERLRLALDAADMGSWELEPDSRNVLCMGQANRIFGFPSDSIRIDWKTFLAQVHQDDSARVSAEIERCLRENSGCQLEFKSRAGAGSRWLRLQAKAFSPNRRNQIDRIVGVIQDVSERKQAEANLRRAATVFESTQNGIVILDKDLCIINANQSYCDMTGYELKELIGQIHYSPSVMHDSKEQEMLATLQSCGIWRGELSGQRKDGSRFPTLTNIAAVRDGDGIVSHYIVVRSDLSSIHDAQKELYRLAHHDALTGLPNRLHAMDRLASALEWAARHNSKVAVLFIDIDHFKHVNDTLGHGTGDELLQTVAARLRSCLRSEDTVARLGGDEFMVVLQEVRRVEEVAVAAEKILNTLGSRIELAGMALSISASIGVSIFPDDGSYGADLIRAADTAMYSAKERGRRRFVFYTPAMTEAAVRYMELNQDLRRGLAAGELRLHYQPQVNLQTHEIIGAEALIRWEHPSKGLLGAADVIPIAEESGIIVDIGDWVIREACRQARVWLDAGLPSLRIAVNASIRQIYQNRLIDTVRDALAQNGLPSSALEVEITESTLQSEDACLSTLQQLHELGVTLAIDDFGTGYSCLNSLKSLPIQRLKIDRTFVRDISENVDDAAIAETIVSMAHRLRLIVVAEGVETKEQELLLRQCGCDEVQGYFYAKPMAADNFSEYLRGKVLRQP
jgi:diguanylate cyclase (GGDEF)-like protein/PAS domain S-box-containing protein